MFGGLVSLNRLNLMYCYATGNIMATVLGTIPVS